MTHLSYHDDDGFNSRQSRDPGSEAPGGFGDGVKVRAVLEEHLGGLVPILTLPAPPPPPVTSVSAGTSIPRPYPMPFSPVKEVKTEVRAVVAALSGPFKFGAVKIALKKNYASFPDTSVRSVLTRMVRAGELQLVERGYGRGGCTFQRTAETAEEAGGDVPEEAAHNSGGIE